MAKAKKKADSQAEQSARFLRAAAEAGVDESGKKFERAFRKLLPRTKMKRVARSGR